MLIQFRISSDMSTLGYAYGDSGKSDPRDVPCLPISAAIMATAGHPRPIRSRNTVLSVGRRLVIRRHLRAVTIAAPRAILPLDTPTAGWDGQAPLPAFSNVPVAGYEILGELGRGGMGVVFRARNIRLNRVVALKMVLSGELASAVELARFKAEAEAAAQLQHPNIVQIYEFGETKSGDGSLLPFFALEYVSGGSLADRLDGTPQPARPSAALIEDLARAMHYAHTQGVIHRDLKPANVLLQSSDGKPTNGSAVRDLNYVTAKITDFGLAKRMDSATGQTQSGAVLGTPQYMAPEQAAGKSKRVGPGTDIYALGTILYELITGRPPFQGETPLETILQVARDEPVAPRLLNPLVPRNLETITLKCLQKDPGRRYASAEALADDLARFLNDQPIAARPAGFFERSRAWVRRHPTVSTMLAVIAVAGPRSWRSAIAAICNCGMPTAKFAISATRPTGGWSRSRSPTAPTGPMTATSSWPYRGTLRHCNWTTKTRTTRRFIGCGWRQR